MGDAVEVSFLSIPPDVAFPESLTVAVLSHPPTGQNTAIRFAGAEYEVVVLSFLTSFFDGELDFGQFQGISGSDAGYLGLEP